MGRRRKEPVPRPRFKRGKLELYAHQEEVERAYKGDLKRRFFLAWHRRAGKDVFGLDFARERMTERVGSYWHVFPFHVQARRAIWKGIDANTGQRFIDRAFPEELGYVQNDTEMSVTGPNGAAWQMLGSDNYDRLVGANPAGIIFSEWALSDPAAWEYVRPILAENQGWAMFITTFRGRNHAWRMYENVKSNEHWYASLRTVDQTRRLNGRPIVTVEDIKKEIDAGMDPRLARQEFYCDPDAPNSGAIFALQHKRLLIARPAIIVPSNKLVQVAWGLKDKGICAVAHQDRNIISVNPFVERNITDAVQSIARRHPTLHVVHAGEDMDRGLFSELDGQGLIDVKLPAIHMMDGRVAALLNTCAVSAAAKELLTDFAMTYTPHRQDLDEDSVVYFEALAQALAVMHQTSVPRPVGRAPNHTLSDRGVI